MITVSIIVLSYNTKELLRSCLESIYNYLPKEIFEVIVLDNASKDGSAEMVKKDFPQVNLIISEKNLGFAKGINTATKDAKGKYLFFLNSDAVLQDDSVLKMPQILDEEKNAGIIGGQLLHSDRSFQRSFGKFYTLPHAILMLTGGEKAELFLNKQKIKQKVDWVTGGFMMIKRNLFEELGGFDEDYFMYIEDMDLCYRAQKKGYDTYFDPDIEAIHSNQGSSNRSFAIKQIHKGLLLFYKKQRSFPEYLVIKFIISFKELIVQILGMTTNKKNLT